MAKEASCAIGVCSTRDGHASVVLAGVLSRALIVLVAVHSVAGVHFGGRFGGVFVVAFPRASFRIFVRAVQICPAFDGHAPFFLTFSFRPALRVISASFYAIDVFVVTSETRIAERVVVAETAVAAVSMLRAFLFFAFSANALANAIFASFGKVFFAG